MPVSKGTGASATPPLPLAAALVAGSSRFVCCEPEASASCNLPHASNSSDTVASTSLRAWTTAMAGDPASSGLTFVPHLRTNLPTQPRSIHGAGGACSGKRPLCAGSNKVGAQVARLTGAK